MQLADLLHPESQSILSYIQADRIDFPTRIDVYKWSSKMGDTFFSEVKVMP